jgi:hypothetical protein
MVQTGWSGLGGDIAGLRGVTRISVAVYSSSCIGREYTENVAAFIEHL